MFCSPPDNRVVPQRGGVWERGRADEGSSARIQVGHVWPCHRRVFGASWWGLLAALLLAFGPPVLAPRAA
eukprot:7158563-Pyramimonas_sp.AAC.1